jgi:hypothetical protein
MQLSARFYQRRRSSKIKVILAAFSLNLLRDKAAE